MTPDQLLFRQHIQEPSFINGLERGMWGFGTDDMDFPQWPNIVLWVEAAPKPSRPDKYHFKFDLSGYPGAAPTACPWNAVNNTRLDNASWPKGAKFVSNTFNPAWNPCALYAPCDRLAMPGHEIWQAHFPELWWQPSFKLIIYLQFLHRLLNSSDYANA
jgi:hypothetical protein